MTNREGQQVRYWPTEKAAPVARIPRRVRASDLSDNHMGRHLRIGDVEGVLRILDPRRTHVVVMLDVGGLKAEFHLLPDAAVEVGRRA